MKRFINRYIIGIAITIIILILLDYARVEISIREALENLHSCNSREEVVKAFGVPDAQGNWKEKNSEGTQIYYLYPFIWEFIPAAFNRLLSYMNPSHKKSDLYGGWYDKWCHNNSRKITILFEDQDIKEIWYRELSSRSDKNIE